MAGCVFCEIVAGRAPAQLVREWPDAIAFVPLNPVTDGHVLVIPRVHVANVGEDPVVSAAVGARVSELVAELPYANVITSKGEAATQTIGHYHEHIVPRRPGDGLLLPWTSQLAQVGAEMEQRDNDPEFQRIRREALAEDRAIEESFSKRDFRVG